MRGFCAVPPAAGGLGRVGLRGGGWAPAQVTAKQSAPAASGRARVRNLMIETSWAFDPGAYEVS